MNSVHLVGWLKNVIKRTVTSERRQDLATLPCCLYIVATFSKAQLDKGRWQRVPRQPLSEVNHYTGRDALMRTLMRNLQKQGSVMPLGEYQSVIRAAAQNNRCRPRRLCRSSADGNSSHSMWQHPIQAYWLHPLDLQVFVFRSFRCEKEGFGPDME